MDIVSGGKWPASALSNFAPHPFVLDGVPCASMEGFLQSLKFKSEDMQAHVCTLAGKAAKRKGAGKNWRETQTLWWRGVPYRRDSDEYQQLLDRAYAALSQNSAFRGALLSTGRANLTHSLGTRDPRDTVLTEREFCGRLMKLRDGMRAEERRGGVAGKVTEWLRKALRKKGKG